ncbi:hypothetical protein ACL03H_01375 [Saccharopolyspora sp. MS10]|uniref:hypothetical protein n=1 Tax=Saccharopolyspora sp. MS10 TaxID=3385973 RepID=UPI0039A29458
MASSAPELVGTAFPLIGARYDLMFAGQAGSRLKDGAAGVATLVGAVQRTALRGCADDSTRRS